AGEPRRERRDLIQIGVLRQADLAYVHLEDLRAALPVRTVDEHLAIEAPRAQKRRIEDLRAIGCGEQDESLARIEAIHLDQELIQRLLLLVVPAQAVRATGAAQRIELVDEDDCRGPRAGLLEEVAHTRG